MSAKLSHDPVAAALDSAPVSPVPLTDEESRELARVRAANASGATRSQEQVEAMIANMRQANAPRR